MTTTDRPVRRQTLSSERERGQFRPIIVELCTTYAKVRLKGCRRSVVVTYSQLWNLGNLNAAEQIRRDRKEAAKKRKESFK